MQRRLAKNWNLLVKSATNEQTILALEDNKLLWKFELKNFRWKRLDWNGFEMVQKLLLEEKVTLEVIQVGILQCRI